MTKRKPAPSNELDGAGIRRVGGSSDGGAVETQVAAAKSLASAKSIQEVVELQTAFAKSAMESYMAAVGVMSETASSSVIISAANRFSLIAILQNEHISPAEIGSGLRRFIKSSFFRRGKRVEFQTFLSGFRLVGKSRNAAAHRRFDCF